ncbi:hypothetical protein C21_01546 [Arenibacter sp. NBRC 103722]|nr:hypothetical protein C21_01546 [Arenibacter sp. NBRC 103722]
MGEVVSLFLMNTYRILTYVVFNNLSVPKKVIMHMGYVLKQAIKQLRVIIYVYYG